MSDIRKRASVVALQLLKFLYTVPPIRRADVVKQIDQACEDRLSAIHNMDFLYSETCFETQFSEILKQLEEELVTKGDVCIGNVFECVRELSNSHSGDIEEDRIIGKKYELTLALFDWQKDAFEKWKQSNYQGICEVATGCGKTILALNCISELKRMNPDLKVAIVVPTIAIMEQWEESLRKHMALNYSDFGEYFGRAKDSFENKEILVFVRNSAAKKGQKELRRADFLIADECHRYTSDNYKVVLEMKNRYRLGLSATPGRKKPIFNMGKIIVRFGLEDAVKAGVLSQFELINIGNELSEGEAEAYTNLTKDIHKCLKQLKARYPRIFVSTKEDSADDDEEEDLLFEEIQSLANSGNITAITYLSRVNQRASLLYNAERKTGSIERVIERELGKKIIIFSERKEFADRIRNMLLEKEIDCALYYSGLSTRNIELKRYKDGQVNILIACKALDEGLDVPATDVALIAAYTNTSRQAIQRIGRVLRKHQEKSYAKVYTLFIKNLQEPKLEQLYRKISPAAIRMHWENRGDPDKWNSIRQKRYDDTYLKYEERKVLERYHESKLSHKFQY